MQFSKVNTFKEVDSQAEDVTHQYLRFDHDVLAGTYPELINKQFVLLSMFIMHNCLDKSDCLAKHFFKLVFPELFFDIRQGLWCTQ